ncbi:MurR/RpiR family transcriptional regulator [Mycoplasma elephantis]|uniref:MurR/RpiR family transcriptional regulator n=1 Tax=Mycoplasma elephantis TaxID=114882 RepID=UPI0004899210|nr:MurR/RpiR family transcriptional regulator [Mycoplasma elephantis]
MKFFVNEIDKLTNSEKKALEYINKSPNEFSSSSIDECAMNSQTSTGVLTRLYKKLNFTSFKELQFYVKHRLLSSDNIYAENEIFSRVSLSYINAINSTNNVIKTEILDYATNSILSSSKVLVFGTGSSSVAAHELALNLQKINIGSYFDADYHAVLLWLGNYIFKNKSKPFVILFSKAGKTKEFNHLLKVVMENDVPYLIITANRVIKYKHKYCILHEITEEKFGFNSLSAKIVQLYICDVILTNVINKLDNKNNILQWNKLIKDWNES